MNASNLTGIAYHKHMANIDKLGVYLYPIKKNGERYAKPNYYEYVGHEKCADDVIARLEGLNPGHKWVAA